MERVAAGEDVVVTRAGKPVARIIPLRRPEIGAAGLLERWRNTPLISADALRADLAEIIDESL